MNNTVLITISSEDFAKAELPGLWVAENGNFTQEVYGEEYDTLARMLTELNIENIA